MVTAVPVSDVLPVAVEDAVPAAAAERSLADRALRTVGTISVLGSGVGVLVTGWLYTVLFASTGLPAAAFVVSLVLNIAATLYFVWGIGAGMSLRRLRPGAMWAALPFWLVQVPIVSSPLATFAVFTGLGIPVTFMVQNGVHLNLGFNFGASYEAMLLNPGAPIGFGINLFAVAVVALLAGCLLKKVWPTIPER